MITAEILKDFDDDFILRDIGSFLDRNNREHLLISYVNEEKNLWINLELHLFDKKIIIKTSTVLPLNKAEVTQVVVHYALKFKHFLEHHPKLRLRFLLNQTSIELGEEFFPYVEKKHLSLRHWIFVERDYKGPLGLFFLLYSISMVLFLFKLILFKTWIIPVISFDAVLTSILYFFTYYQLKKKYEKIYPLKNSL